MRSVTVAGLGGQFERDIEGVLAQYGLDIVDAPSWLAGCDVSVVRRLQAELLDRGPFRELWGVERLI